MPRLRCYQNFRPQACDNSRSSRSSRTFQQRAFKLPRHRAYFQGKSCNGIQSSKKKAIELPNFKTTILPAREDDMEVDELFTFVQMKIRHIRIWIVQCRRTRQILSFFIGDGSIKSCKALWRKLPYSYMRCVSFSDFWRAYGCLPEKTHSSVGKEAGQTNHIERLNNTLRQRVSRLVRKTLSFTKREYMLNVHFKYFAFFYNQETASTHF